MVICTVLLLKIAPFSVDLPLLLHGVFPFRYVGLPKGKLQSDPPIHQPAGFNYLSNR
jgi:hypothetical protein